MKSLENFTFDNIIDWIKDTFNFKILNEWKKFLNFYTLYKK